MVTTFNVVDTLCLSYRIVTNPFVVGVGRGMGLMEKGDKAKEGFTMFFKIDVLI